VTILPGVRDVLVFVSCAGALSCAPAAPRPWLPAPTFAAATAPTSAPVPSAPVPSAATTEPEPSLFVFLRPIREPLPLVHVAIDLDAPASRLAADLSTWRMTLGSLDRVVHLAAQDPSGPLSVKASAEGSGLVFTLGGSPKGHIHFEYDVLAAGDAPPLGALVHGNRFRGAGEVLIALPEAIEERVLPVSLEIDAASLEAEKAASSLGVGARRTTRLRPRALRYACFVAGAQGDVVFDTIDGHDEASWTGFPAFDLRETVVELAEERTVFATVLGARHMLPDVPWTYLFEVSGSRSPGTIEVTPRFDGMLVQLASSDSMGTPLRMAMGQLLARRWIGDAIRLAPAGHTAELGWFDDGVARYLATRVLARVGVLAPKDWAQVIGEGLSVLATSALAKEGNASLSARANEDPEARLVLMMRGALYASLESAVIAARSRGSRTLETVLSGLFDQARAQHDGTIVALSPGAWLEAVAREDPDAVRTFDAMVVRGGPIALPPAAMGPCFRAGTGEYVAFDPGFDVDATLRARDHRPVGLRPGGPAATAGLGPTDTVESIQASQGDVTARMNVVVARGDKKVALSYWPRGRRGRGQTWSRLPGVPDDKCGLPP
jgi:hypothetical protein